MTVNRHKIARLALVATVFCITLAVAQNSSKPDSSSPAGNTQAQSSPLAAAAQEAKARKAKAAKVFTDEDMDVHTSPIPIMNLDGDENTEAVVGAIQKYKEKHKPQETEAAVHDWYDEYDAMLASNAREAGQYRSLRETNTLNGYDLCQQSTGYEHCEKRRQSELRGQRMDAAKIRQDMEKVGRIQQGLMKVQRGLTTLHLKYSWFKVRNGNGVGYLFQ